MMSQASADIKFVYGARASYNVADKDDNTLYFVLETNGSISFYLGNTLINEGQVNSLLLTKQSVSPLDNKQYVLYNGSIKEISYGAGNFNETYLATISNGGNIAVSVINDYKALKLLYRRKPVGSGTYYGDSRIVDVDIFSIIGANVWMTATENEWNAGNKILDNLQVADVNEFISYMTAYYPPAGQEIGDVARANDGALPLTYFYVKVGGNALQYGGITLRGNSDFDAMFRRTSSLAISLTCNVDYELLVYGIDW